MGVAGALRRSARDRALPQPRRRPVRPAPPHAVRHPGHRGRLRRALRHLGGDGRRRHHHAGRGSCVVRHRCAVGALPPRHPRPGRLPRRPAPHRPVAGRAGGRRRPAGGRRSARRRAGCRWWPAVVDEVASLTVFQRSRQLVHAAEQPADHRRGAGAAARRLRAAARGAEHLDPRVPPPDEHPQRLRRLGRGAAGLLRADVGEPRVHEVHEQLRRPAHEPRGERRVVRVHRRQDPQPSSTTPTPPSG